MKKVYMKLFAVFMVFYINLVCPGFLQTDENAYLNGWDKMINSSFSHVLSECKTTNYTESLIMDTVILPYENGYIYSSSAQKKCNSTTLCVVPKGATMLMNSNLITGALLIQGGGNVLWNDKFQTQNKQWLCAGYIVVENGGIFNVSLRDQSKNAYIYLKDNGAKHESFLQSRVLGGLGYGGGGGSGSEGVGPIISISGYPMQRTWSLLSETANLSDVSSGAFLNLVHNPIDMGWQIGDRIVVSSMRPLSTGTAMQFSISDIDNNKIYITKTEHTIIQDTILSVDFKLSESGAISLLSPEVINLSRNVIITGDDFRHIDCNSSLTDYYTAYGCSCNPSISKTKCTMGLHVMIGGKGILDIQYTRIEKCGQRGIMGKYCLHFHYMNECPECIFRGNALEFGQQRGIVIHETHLALVENNVLNDIRGAGIYIEDGNEIYNKILYNVVLCPFPLGDPVFQGCTVPGTDNSQADTALNQAGLWSLNPTNNVIGNRFSNSFNGMFYDCGDERYGHGGAYGLVDTLFSQMGRLEGNTFHGHGRFGTYVLFYFPKNNCISNISNNGFLIRDARCSAFTSQGENNGISVAHIYNVDYSNAFVGGYNVNDLQYQKHSAFNNLNNIYWKETNNFADGCSAHIYGGHYENGNIALPDMAGFIIENTIFAGSSQLETNHHCNDGITGFLCMPTYILSNVSWRSTSQQWVQWHQEANNYGGIIILSPSESPNNISRGFFPPLYCSLVSNYWTYLLYLDGCFSTLKTENVAGGGLWLFDEISDLGDYWNGIETFYSGGILCSCSSPLRSLKIYSRGQTLAQHMDLNLEIYETLNNKWITNFTVPYHQIGDDSSATNKQGYAFPVVSGTKYTYKIGGIGGGESGMETNIPASWIIEFSEQIFGNRWKPDELLLTVVGRECYKKKITSQHDRRWLLADSNDYLYPESWGRGACNNSYPDMPLVNCKKSVDISIDFCHLSCPGGCINGYCDCGLKKCVCESGYYGDTCKKNVCDGITCLHGKCIGKYLGGELLPTRGSCVCEAGWSGPACDSNPCKNVDCSGRGNCVASSETDWKCKCQPNYSGKNCNNTCINFGCYTDYYPYGCAQIPTMQTLCLKGSGCYYSNTWFDWSNSNVCCYENCDACDLVNCELPINDCYIAGSCAHGNCNSSVIRDNGSVCNNVAFGICLNGECLSQYLPFHYVPSIVVPTLVPTFSKSSIVYTIYPSSAASSAASYATVMPSIAYSITRVPTQPYNSDDSFLYLAVIAVIIPLFVIFVCKNNYFIGDQQTDYSDISDLSEESDGLVGSDSSDSLDGLDDKKTNEFKTDIENK
jgi:hypothetical protein